MSRFSNRRNRRLPTTAAIVASFALFCGSEAAAYGPMTHMGEAERAAGWLASGQGGPSVPPQLVDLASRIGARQELRLHLHLGCILPDMREAAPSIAFATHSRPFALHMLFNVACDDQRDLLHRAIALGYASHICSDIAAQVFAVPFFAAGGGAGASWLEHWPVWRAEPLAASTIQSLSGVAGPEFGAGRDVTVYDLWWEDADTSDAITSIDSTALPARVRLVVEVFPVAPTDNPILVRIRKGLPAAEYLAGGVVAETRVETGWSPFELNGNPPFHLELEADLNSGNLAYAEGLHAELATPADTEGSATVFFTTSWEAFEDIDSLDLTRPVYPLNFSTYDHWPGSVRVRPIIGDDTPPSAPLVDFHPERRSAHDRIVHEADPYSAAHGPLHKRTRSTSVRGRHGGDSRVRASHPPRAHGS